VADIAELLAQPDAQGALQALPADKRLAYLWRARWIQTAHAHQVLPPGDWWSVWLMLAGRGAGKLLCVDTPIPTPSGWVRNGDIRDGDVVFDERGNPCRVVEAHPITVPETAYRVTFSDGSTIDAGGEHLWTTMTHRTRKQMQRHGIDRVPDDWATYRHPLLDSHHNIVGLCGAETLTTAKIAQTLTYSARGDLNHCIPTTQPLNLPEADLLIDPWTLGYWLGNGDSKGQRLTAGSYKGNFDDTHVLNMLGRECTITREAEHGRSSVRVPGLRRQLKAAGLLGNKHIPAVYMRASVAQRLALLRGLCDSDGYADHKIVEFCSVDKVLAQDVHELVVSLGEKAALSEGRAMLNGEDYGPKYRVTWRWARFNPFSLPRKAEKLGPPKAQGFKHGHRMIVSVEPIEPKPMRCLTVDSPSRLYLVGRSMIPTHNTRTAAEQVGWWAWTEPGTRWLVAAPTSADVQGTCFEGESGLLAVIPPPLVKQYLKQPRPTITLTNGSMLIGIPASEPERFRGPQFHGAWLDELAAWDYIQESWDQIQFGVRLGQRTRTVITTTPRPKDLIVELIGREGDDVTVTRASTYVNLGNLSSNFKRQILQYEGTKLGRQELHAEIIDPEDGGIVKRDQFRLWPKDKPFPKFEYVLQSYDCATSEKTQNDPTAASTWGVFKPEDGPMAVMLIDCWQDRLQYPDLRPKVIEEYDTVFESGEKGRDRKRVDLILVEDKSAGISLIQDLQRAHLPVRAYNPGKADKVQRLNIVSAIIARGRVWIPESTQRPGFVRDWAEPFVSQICSFPETTHDDFVDTATQALRYLRDSGWLEIDPPPQDDWDDDDWADTGRPKRENPYAA
jgi:predicted phage terminase large subunit-like protein